MSASEGPTMGGLTSLPTWGLVLVSLAVCGAFAAGTRWWLQRMLPEEQRQGAATIAAPLMPALGAAFALLAALSLAGEADQLRTAESHVTDEATAATRVAWGATSPGIDRVGVQSKLRVYLQATEGEWNNRDGRGDERARAALADLERVVRAEAAGPRVSSAQATELLSALDTLSSGRRQRLAAAHHGLPDFYVAVVAVSGLALIANSSVLALGARRRLAYVTATLVVVVALALALLFAITAPFRGGLVASRGAIDNVVADLEAGVFRP